jgi:hypothetical protein
LLYAEVGILGVLAWLAVLVVALVVGFASLRAPPGPLRAVAAACLAGMVLIPAAAAAYDFADVPQSGWTLSVLLALAVAIAEISPRREVRRRWRWSNRALLPMAGFVAGAVVFAVTPAHSAATYRFETIAPIWVANAPKPETFTGSVLAETACAVMTEPPQSTGVSIECRRVDLTQPAWLGVGELRVQAGSADQVRAVSADVLDRAKGVVPGVSASPLGGIQSGRPTWARTAPVWFALSCLILALLIPPMTRHRDGPEHTGPMARRRSAVVV